ncbi:AI-2E family transporter [Rubrivirga sp.]|uniref:AI-2E family transporter n=1 Tax=Rubrivirga sp. TaxID=1885344 RepID=UPI003C72467E
MTPEHSTPLDTSVAFRRKARYVVALVTATVVLLYVAWITRAAILLVLLGVAVGVLFYHSSRWLSERTGVPRGLALAGVVLVILSALGSAIAVGGPHVVGEATALIDEAPAVIETVRERFDLPPDVLRLPQGASEVVGRALGIFSSLAGALAAVLVVLLVAVYTAIDPSRYTSSLLRLVDYDRQPFAQRVLERSGEVLLGWLKGVGIAVLALGTIAAIGLSVIGLPGALALAAFAALMTVIPNIGPFIGWAPAVLVAFSQGTTVGLWTLGLAVVAQQIEGGFIEPKVLGGMVKVGPAFIVAGQIVLGALTGFLGLLLVVPVLGVGKVLLQELYIGPLVRAEPADPDAPPDHARHVPGAALETPTDAPFE